MDLFKKHPKLIILNGVAIVVLGLLTLFPKQMNFYDVTDYLGWHIILEMVSIIISFSIFILGWKLSNYNMSAVLLFLSITFLCVGIIDIFHTLTFLGMPHFITDSSISKTTWFWVLGRGVCAILVLAIFTLTDRKISRRIARFYLFGSILFSIIAILLIFTYENNLPELLVEGSGPTLLKNTIEYFISLIYIVLIYIAYLYYKKNSSVFAVNMMIGLSMMLLSEINFMLFNSIYDINNFYGHILKAIAYYFILKAFYSATIDYEMENEKKVTETKEDLSRLLRMQDGIIFKYFKHEDHFILSLCEGELLENLEYNASSCIGRKLEEMSIIKETNCLENFHHAWSAQGKVNFEITFENRNLYVTLKPIRQDGSVCMVIGSMADITELKQMEAAVQNSEKLGIVGELAAGIAHELRNPLTTLKGFLQLIKPDMPEIQKSFMELMLTEVDRLELITHELMGVARPQAAIYKPECITTIIQDVIRLLHPQAVLQGIQIHFSGKTDNCSIICDLNQLKQVWINLIKNALEAMPNGGNIYIDAASVDPDNIMLTIKDEGTGMSQETLKKLGQPFFTLKEGGHGLGIMMTKRIIDTHNGKMEVSSEVGIGTVFRLEFPVINNSQLTAS